MHDPVQSNLSCGSDTAHMNILGYNPFKLYNGRGAFETMGSGIKMDCNEIAFKCNFAYLNTETRIVESRRVDRHFDWGVPLCDYLNGMKIPGYPEYSVECQYATEHRCGLKISGPNLSTLISELDPLKDNKLMGRCIPLDDSSDAQTSAKIVQACSDEIERLLQAHDINKTRKAAGLTHTNVVLMRGCGKRLTVPSFEETHGLKAFMVAPTAII